VERRNRGVLKSKRYKPKKGETESRDEIHRGGNIHSSKEESVMGLERRDIINQLNPEVNCENRRN